MSTTATGHPNAQRMREVAEAVTAGDVAAALERFSQDVVWYVPGGSSLDRVYHGHDGLKRFFGTFMERSKGTLRPEATDVLASDDHVVIFLHITAKGEGADLDVRVAHFAAVGPDGFTGNWFLPDDVGAWNRFFA
jgi:ketosteroid isomerase-like protein